MENLDLGGGYPPTSPKLIIMSKIRDGYPPTSENWGGYPPTAVLGSKTMFYPLKFQIFSRRFAPKEKLEKYVFCILKSSNFLGASRRNNKLTFNMQNMEYFQTILCFSALRARKITGVHSIPGKKQSWTLLQCYQNSVERHACIIDRYCNSISNLITKNKSKIVVFKLY